MSFEAGGGVRGEEAGAQRVWGSQEGRKLGCLERGERDRATDQGLSAPTPFVPADTPPHRPWLWPSAPPSQ